MCCSMKNRVARTLKLNHCLPQQTNKQTIARLGEVEGVHSAVFSCIFRFVFQFDSSRLNVMGGEGLYRLDTRAMVTSKRGTFQ